MGEPQIFSRVSQYADETRKLLTEYSDWLHKKGYIDSDYYTEEPLAVDAFLEYRKSLLTKKL